MNGIAQELRGVLSCILVCKRQGKDRQAWKYMVRLEELVTELRLALSLVQENED